MTRPRCYNRPPVQASYVAAGGVVVPHAFVDRCATWDGTGIGPKGEPYPLAHGWDCRGCMWLPSHAKLLTDASTLTQEATPL